MLFHCWSRARMQRRLVICSPALNWCNFGQVSPLFYPLRSAQIVVTILNLGLGKCQSYQSYESIFLLCRQLCILTFPLAGLEVPISKKMKIIIVFNILIFVDIAVLLVFKYLSIQYLFKKYLFNAKEIEVINTKSVSLVIQRVIWLQ